MPYDMTNGQMRTDMRSLPKKVLQVQNFLIKCPGYIWVGLVATGYSFVCLQAIVCL